MKKIIINLILVISLNICIYAGDIQITITIPEIYQQELIEAIDLFDPKPDGISYPNHLKNIIKNWLKDYVKKSKHSKAVNIAESSTYTTIEVN